MSHAFIFMRFVNGESCAINTAGLLELATQHGFISHGLTEGANDLLCASEPNLIGDLFVYVRNGEVREVAIDRPRYQDQTRQFCYALLSKLGLVMFFDNGSCLMAGRQAGENLPSGFADHFTTANTNVTGEEQLP